MSIDHILSQKSHRPWPLPQGEWKFYQEWNRTIFLHWKVEESVLRQFVPDALELDFFEKSCWVSLVAFSMEKVRPRKLPNFAPVSNFHEINIRTYVRYRNKPGVYFFSIEGGKPLSCLLARHISGLPYRYSTMLRNPSQYLSFNGKWGEQFQLHYELTPKKITKTNLDLWLTERYALFQDYEGSHIHAHDIHHTEWSLSPIILKELKIQYQRFDDLFYGAPDKVHYSEGVPVLVWPKQVFAVNTN